MMPTGRDWVYVALYRRYRPQRFGEMVGQDAAARMLQSSFREKRLGHAYLFSGPRGCGKTTAARLLAKVVNCAAPVEGEPCGVCDSCVSIVAGDHMDVMEIDGASNRGIDQIRELKSHVGLASFLGGMKVYILDEVHMLTAEAFNALLKTLEEPPAGVLFIFATTEPHKVPVTIRSRCQHIPFHRITTEDMVVRLRDIAAAEGFPADDAALWEVARNADGALRDALSLAEQAVALGEGALTLDAVRDLFGGGSRFELERWVSLLRERPEEAASLLRDLLNRGVTPERFLDALFPLFRDMWVYGMWGEGAFAGISLSEAEQAFLRAEVPHWRDDQLRRASAACTALFPRARWGMRTEVFSGLLLFELLGILRGDAPQPVAAPVPPAADHPPAEARREEAAPSAAVAAAPVLPPPARLRREPTTESVVPPVVPAASAETADPSLPDGLPEVFSALWRDDMPLCAALIDVGVAVGAEGISLDFSEAPPAARAILGTLRAQQAIARAFGVDGNTAEAAPPAPAAPARSGGEARPAPKSGEVRTVAAAGMSVQALSAYLGADLLMSKSVAGDDGLAEIPEAMGGTDDADL